jgi:EAL domain-containing protein (putative c-di-GMP-specific phosphodiesterase class I)
MFPQDGTDAETLLENALSALDDARNSPSDSYKFHSGTVNLRALQRKDLELELQAALDREEFSLHYLPIVDTRTQQVTSVEALLRWPQAAFGTKPIQKIVALAECMGLILPIGDWVMRQSIAQLRSWHAGGHPNLRLSLNVSMQQFARTEFFARLKELLASHAIAASYLDLEITEYMLFRDALKDYATCKEFKQHGLGVVIDNYGTGACSLAHFSRSPVDAVKIDNSFVTNMTTHAEDRNACAAITALAHALGRKVIASGVETTGQAALLTELACDFLQGFHYTRPLPAADVAGFLANPIEPVSGI